MEFIVVYQKIIYIINTFFPDNVNFKEYSYSYRLQGVSTMNMDYPDDLKDLVLEKFEAKFLPNMDEDRLKEAKLNGLKLLFENLSFGDSIYYNSVEERAQEISNKFGIGFTFDDYKLILEDILERNIENNNYEGIINYIMIFDNENHDLLNYLKKELAK